MARTGRGDPCPCGSGRQFDKCCLVVDGGAARTAVQPPAADGLGASGPVVFLEDDTLDDESNAVLDLVNAGCLDEAETAAQVLLRRYPDVPDGLERLGLVCEKRGDRKRAAAYYRKAVAFMNEHGGFNDEVISWLRGKADRLDPQTTGERQPDGRDR